MNWRPLGYAIACVVVPVAWGLLVVRVSNWAERTLKKRRVDRSPPQREEEFPPIDYHI